MRLHITPWANRICRELGQLVSDLRAEIYVVYTSTYTFYACAKYDIDAKLCPGQRIETRSQLTVHPLIGSSSLAYQKEKIMFASS